MSGLRTKSTPTVVATHSGDFLDMLDDPARQVIILKADAQLRARATRLDENALNVLMAKRGGLGRLRQEGLLGPLEVPVAVPAKTTLDVDP